jgi:hypothetical protein
LRWPHRSKGTWLKFVYIGPVDVETEWNWLIFHNVHLLAILAVELLALSKFQLRFPVVLVHLVILRVIWAIFSILKA